jgi:two-component system OmpR family sensor kinase
MMSIRLRFTLLYSFIIALTLLVFGVVLYTIQAQNTLNALKRDLSASGEDLARVTFWTYLHPDQFEFNPENRPPPIQAEQLSGQAVFRNSRERQIVRVLDANGQILASPFGANEDPLPISAAGLEALQSQKVWWETATPGTERLLIYNHPIVYDGQSLFILQVARPLTERDRSLANLSRTLIIASLLTTTIAFGIGWVLIGAALSPIHRITQTAQTIGDESDDLGQRGANELALSRRVDYTGPNDEIGQLAKTFNSMLSRLELAYQRVSQTLKLQREFVADVSHELRTPLTTVRGNLALLRHDPPLPEEEQADILTDLVEESDRLIRLVNGLLVMARADTGFDLVKEPVPIRPLVEEVCRQAKQLDPQREITESVQDANILGDRDATKQVLLILLDNALKHSQGSVFVTVEPNQTQVEISVRDVGPGIPPEALPHVFDRFFRAEASAAVPGFGLGLSIAKSLVEGQGGTITIESQVGVGSTVRVQLPSFSE